MQKKPKLRKHYGDKANYTKSPLEAKYFGSYYKNIAIDIVKTGGSVSSPIFNIRVYYKGSSYEQTLEQYYRLTLDTYKAALSASEYIGYIDLSAATTSTENTEDNSTIISGGLGIVSIFGSNKTGKITVELGQDYSSDNDNTNFGDVKDYETFEKLLSDLLTEKDGLLAKLIGNELENPIDVVLDAGYSEDIKKELFTIFCKDDDDDTILLDKNGVELKVQESIRNDVFLFLDAYGDDGKRDGLLEPLSDLSSTLSALKSERLAVYDQYYTVNDSVFTNQDILVTPSYYVAKLLPYIDNNYGPQWAMSGTRRAVLDDVKNVNENPTNSKKQDNFEKRINYSEKTAREIAFMSQRTHDGSTEDDYTALSFINNSRVLERIKKELKVLGRDYLFEFNDAATLANMSSVLNKYLTNWISNRTLSYAEAIVRRNQYNEEAVDVALVVRFNGTIEVITVDITIE